jgi:hypothetical protein
VKVVTSEDVIETLKANGKGWSDDVGDMLALPRKLFVMRSEEASFYSGDLRFGIMGINSALAAGKLSARETDYGIALYSTGGSIYFVLADLKRRIIVRERVFCIHDKPPEKDWAEVKERIGNALSLATSDLKEGSVIISDQIVRKVKLSSV